eukprot:6952818-Alexandrium_andersonii.AAC.1
MGAGGHRLVHGGPRRPPGGPDAVGQGGHLHARASPGPQRSGQGARSVLGRGSHLVGRALARREREWAEREATQEGLLG